MAALPETMIAIDPAEPGGPEVLRPVSRPVPRPGAGEVLIKVEAAGVNRPDIVQRIGNYPPPKGAPTIPGLEVSGRVVAVGDAVGADLIGQPVCALIAGGGYAEYALAPVGQCLTVPPAITMIEAAAMPETLFTVWTNLFERAYAVEGDTVLVHGGTSGIGTMAIALGKLFGITMIVTCGSDEKCAAARALGADVAINYRSEDFVEVIKQLTGKKGVNVTLDMVGGSYVAREVSCAADDGRIVLIAFLDGPEAKFDIMTVMRKRLSITGSTLRARPVPFKAAIAQQLREKVWPLIETGKIKPVIYRTFPLEQAMDAHKLMESSAHIGKIVLTVA